MRGMMQAASSLGLMLPAASAMACPYCAQDRGAGLFLIAAISLLPLALAAGVWWQVKRISEPGRSAGGGGISSAGTHGYDG
jgi:hypothetical protein